MIARNLSLFILLVLLAGCGRGLVSLSSAGSLTISQGSMVSFGARYAGQGYDTSLTLTNSGEGSISDLSGLMGRAGEFVFKGGAFPGTGGTCGATLGPHASCTVVITFTPPLSGAYSGAVEFTAGGQTYSVGLTGTGLGGGADPTFGTSQGLAFHTVNSVTEFDVSGAALFPDGKIAVHGTSHSFNEYSLLRFNSDGSIDSTFGTDGRTSVTNAQVGSAFLTPGLVAIDTAANKAYVAASARIGLGNFNIALTRYTSTGALDASFSGDGIVLYDGLSAGLGDYGSALGIQTDGKILVTGVTSALGTNNLFIARYLTNGALDPTYGTGGEAVPGISTLGESVAALAIDSLGRAVVGGGVSAGGFFLSNYLIARYQTDGVLDSTFATNGLYTTAFSTGIDRVLALVIQTDGKILAKAWGGFATTLNFMRLTTDGVLDSSFGTGGVVALNTLGFGAEMILLPSGGWLTGAGSGLGRFLSTGALDSTFGAGNGILPSTEINSGNFGLNDFCQQSDGHLILMGRTTGSPYTTILTRRLP